jgi:membrane peptidoglycan carboxypeptidase
MRKRDRNMFANGASLLVCGVLAGLVVAAAAFPAIALGGLVAKASADGFGDLPSELKVQAPPQITFLYASDNKTLLGTFYAENRLQIRLTDIPKVMRDAIIAAEDERFYDHNGVDLQGIVRAFVANQRSDSTQGASTLTMQYVRQAITYSATSPAEVIAATEQTNIRKLREIRLAIELESVATKDEILEGYLNIAAFGHGAYGIYAAAQVYFNKKPKDLTLGEATLLAALPKAPSEFDPVDEKGRKAALDRRAYVLNQMVKLGTATKAEADEAKKTTPKIYGRRTPNGCVNTVKNHWGFFCDYFYRWWLAQKEFGRDEAEREGRLKSAGYRIVSTLDVKTQDSAQKHVEGQLKIGSRDALMVAAIEPGTGRVKAVAANRYYGLNDSKNKISSDPAKKRKGIKGTYPTTTNPLLSGGGDIGGYKAGSTFKMFTMLAALEAGYPLDYTIRARSPYKSKYITSPSDESICGDRVHWCPRNANPEYMNGNRNMWGGFGRSVNTYFVPLQERIGTDKAVNMAVRLGIGFRSSDRVYLDPQKARGLGPFTIGVTDTVPLELANAYATVAADGKYCKPTPVRKMFTSDRKEVQEITEPRCEQVVKPDVARAAIDAARCPIYDGGGLGRCTGGTSTAVNGKRVAQVVGHPVFGKTGTSDFNWTANLVLSTKHLAVAGTLANPDFAKTPHGNDAAVRVNAAVTLTMRDALKGKGKVQFKKPSQRMVFGKRKSIPFVRCLSERSARARVAGAGFEVSTDLEPVASSCPEGTVARTDPQGTTSEGSNVTLVLSKGGGDDDEDDGGGG